MGSEGPPATAPTIDATLRPDDDVPVTAPGPDHVPARPSPALARIGKFTLLDPLGSGGMGVVYEALDTDLARKVAIKLVATHASDARAQARLLREAQAQAQLSHPNVVAVYEVGSSADGQLFIAMELVKGPTLRTWQDGGPRRWQDIVAVYAGAGAGLAAAHRTGIVHRDFKPDNVLIGEDGRPRVTDFGLAFAVEAARASAEPSRTTSALARDVAGPTQPSFADASGAPGLTEPSFVEAHGGLAEPSFTNANAATRPTRPSSAETSDPPGATVASASVVARARVAGTLGYISPEQLAGDPVDARADQFAFCVALYEALHGARPAAGASERPERRRTTAAYPRWLWDAVARGLARDPAHRFASMDALLAELTRRRDRLRRRTAIAVAAAAVLVTAGAAFALQPAAQEICPRGTDELGGIWDPSAKQRVHAALAGTGAPFAAQVWASTETAFDRYAGRWLDAQQAACRATHVEHVQSEQLLDRRTDCLEGRRRALAAATEVLRDRPAQAIVHAGELVGGLADIAPCGDAAAMLELGSQRAAIPPAARAKLAELHTQLARAHALMTTEDLGGADAALAIATGVARALDGESAQPELDYATARLQMIRGDLAGAVARFERAAARAIGSHDDELAADVYLTLARAAAERELKPAEGQRWLGQAEAWLDRLGHGGDERRIVVEQARSYLQIAAGDASAALATASRAISEAERRWSPSDPRLVPLLVARATAQAKLGQAAAAVADAERAVRVGVEAWGDGYADVARARRLLGILYVEQLGDVARGEAELTAAIHSFDAQGEPDSFEVAGCEQGLSEVAQYRGDLAGVLAHAARAEQIFARWLGASHPRRAEALNGVAVARFLLRDYAGALADYEAVYPIWRDALGADHASVGMLLSNTGEALLALGRLDAAQADFERALAILGKALPADSTDRAYPLKGLGLTQLQRGRPRDAVAPLEQALTLRIRTGTAGDPTEVAEIQWGLARSLHALGREPARARQLARDALAGYRGLGDQLGWRVREISQATLDW